MTRRRAADLIFVLTGPRSYQSFVLEAGWPPRDWVRWVTATLRHDLFGDYPDPAARRAARTAATAQA